MFRVFIPVAIVALCSLAPAQTPTGVDPASLTPADALIYVGVEDVNGLWERWKKTKMYAELNDPAVKDVAKESQIFAKFVETVRSRLAKTLDRSPDQVQNPLGGPLAIFVARDDDAPREVPPHPVVVAGVADSKLMREYYDVVTKKLRASADKAESISFGSGSIDYFTHKKSAEDEHAQGDEAEVDSELQDMADEAGDDEADPIGRGVQSVIDEMFSPDSIPEQLALYLTDKRLVIAQTPDEVKQVMRVPESGKSLADSDIGKQFARQFKPLGQVRVSVNVPRFVELDRRHGEENAVRMMDALGVKSMRAIIAQIDLAGEKYDSSVDVMLLLEGERTGLAKILSPKNAEFAPPLDASGETAMCLSMHLNPADVLDEILRITRQMDPERADEMAHEMESVPVGGERVNIRKDIVDNLSEPVTMSLSFARPFGTDSPRVLFSINHRNRAALQRVLELTPLLTPRDLQGTTIFDLPVGGMSVATTSTRMMLGTLPAVEAGMRATGEGGLSSEAEFKRALALAPREGWLMIYADGRKMLEAAVGLARHREKLQSAMMNNFATAIAFGIASATSASFEDGKLDQAGKLVEYQSPSILTITTTSDGVRATQFNLKPEKK
ncbi:MAG: hypothetical protein U1D55_08350 [Phycisphaerae bacterium]